MISRKPIQISVSSPLQMTEISSGIDRPDQPPVSPMQPEVHQTSLDGLGGTIILRPVLS